MNTYIKDLNARYSTKKFDPSKKVNSQDLEEIVEVFRLSASSFGLQPWKLFIVEDETIKQKLQEQAYNQEQVGVNSHILVFAKPKEITDELVEKYITKYSKIAQIPESDLAGLKNMMLGFIQHTPKNDLDTWAHEQVFLALGNVMSFLAYKKIDSCAVGGFDKNAFNTTLKLDEKGYESVVILPIGYRSVDDKYQNKPKIRFDTKDIVEYV